MPQPSLTNTDHLSLKKKIESHNRWRTRLSLNLIPAENLPSPSVRRLLSSDLGARYTSRDHFYMGTRYLDEVEAIGVETAKKVFRCKFADLRPLSGHLCNVATYLLFTKRGDTVVTVAPRHGGYPGSSRIGLGKLLGLQNLSFPFDQRRMNIEEDGAIELLESTNPRLAMFGSSFILFPHPCGSISARVSNPMYVYDGSHVLGLIAGRQFQDPLKEGCSLLIGSTHKSFFGPQGGIMLADDPRVGEAIENGLYPGIVDNAHWNRIAALTLALMEFEKFGVSYAERVVENAHVLARALYDEGVPVKCPEGGFTRSHQVIPDIKGSKERGRIARELEASNIIVDCGIRIGTGEVTRRGMGRGEMEVIASLMASVIQGRERTWKIRKRIRTMLSEFQKVQYSFDA